MILFTILALVLIFLGIVAVFALALGGTIGLLIFADAIVCVIIVVAIIRWYKNKRR